VRWSAPSIPGRLPTTVHPEIARRCKRSYEETIGRVPGRNDARRRRPRLTIYRRIVSGLCLDPHGPNSVQRHAPRRTQAFGAAIATSTAPRHDPAVSSARISTRSSMSIGALRTGRPFHLLPGTQARSHAIRSRNGLLRDGYLPFVASASSRRGVVPIRPSPVAGFDANRDSLGWVDPFAAESSDGHSTVRGSFFLSFVASHRLICFAAVWLLEKPGSVADLPSPLSFRRMKSS